MYIRTHRRIAYLCLLFPLPPCLNLNRLLPLRPQLHATAYHSLHRRTRPLIQSEYKCCPLKQAGNGGKPSTTSTTELFLRPRFFSSSLRSSDFKRIRMAAARCRRRWCCRGTWLNALAVACDSRNMSIGRGYASRDWLWYAAILRLRLLERNIAIRFIR